MRDILPSLLILFGIFHFSSLSGQNLIPNPSFEAYSKCPKGLGQIERCEGWSSPTTGTPDYFNACFQKDPGTVGVPNNFFGTCASYKGFAYVGLLHGREEKEYVQVRLLEPLVEGRKYCLRFRAASPLPNAEGREGIGALFRSEASMQKNWKQLEALPEEWMQLSRDDFGGRNWEMMSGQMLAKGGEQFLVIGYQKDLGRKAYTFLDGLELYESTSAKGCGEDLFYEEEQDSLNLVPNSGFELIYGCPLEREDLKMAKGWRVEENSPDLYHRCGQSTATVPDNIIGYQEPHSGSGYGGLWAKLGANGEYREFMSTRLKHPLEAGKRYCLSIWISLAEVSDNALDHLQLLVGEDEASANGFQSVTENELVTLSNNKLLDNFEEWVLLYGTFEAKGGEECIFIGNFKENAAGNLHPIASAKNKKTYSDNCAYYFIDDVGLHELGAATCLCPGQQLLPKTTTSDTLISSREETWQAGDTLVLRNLQFAYDRAELLPQSLPLLDSLARFLNRNLDLSISIIGHTDSDGDASYNQRLSQSRAQSVLNYLSSQGIAADRMSASGQGEASPCASNANEAGKALNRRVEVSFR